MALFAQRECHLRLLDKKFSAGSRQDLWTADGRSSNRLPIGPQRLRPLCSLLGLGRLVACGQLVACGLWLVAGKPPPCCLLQLWIVGCAFSFSLQCLQPSAFGPLSSEALLLKALNQRGHAMGWAVGD
jgi:hypothetical protein